MLTGISIVMAAILFTNIVGISAQTTNLDPNVTLQTLEDAKQKVLKIDNNPDLPVFVSWVDEKTNILVVGIKDDPSIWSFFYDLFYPLQEKEVYEQRLKSLVGDLPMKVEFGKFVPEACSSRGGICDPVIGGVAVQPSGATGSTLTFKATSSTYGNGIVISGHGAQCTTGQQVAQPYSVYSGRNVAQVVVNPGNDRYSDAAFAKINTGFSGDTKIFNDGSSTYNIIGKKSSSQTPTGTSVRMSGLISGVTSGTITAKGVGFVNEFCGTWDLSSQILSNYASSSGDSGAPIFSVPDASNNVYIYGIHVGTLTLSGINYKVYSPWESIASELGVS